MLTISHDTERTSPLSQSHYHGTDPVQQFSVPTRSLEETGSPLDEVLLLNDKVSFDYTCTLKVSNLII